MRTFLFLLCCFLAFPTLWAQGRAPEYIDVVSLKDGGEVTGTVVEYIYGKKAVVVLDNGDLQEIAAENIRRVNFRLDRYRLSTIKRQITQQMEVKEAEADTEVFVPTRKFNHQVTAAINIGRSSVTQFSTSTTIGGSFAYHLVKQVKFLNVGAGLDVSLMSEARNENVVAATVFAESAFSINGGRLKPLIRLEAGPSLPFGNSGTDDEIVNRSISVLIHPSIG
ncbi:MAG: hypothetical protein AAF597_01205, partial [Bacteroidota bacterium]